VFEEGLEAGVEPDAGSFTALVNGWARLGEVDRAVRWFDEMKKRVSTQPEVWIYHALINAHIQQGEKARDPGQVEQAERLLEEMLEQGIEPNGASFNALIEGWAKHGEIEHAARWLDKTKQFGLTPNQSAYNALFVAHVMKGKKERAPKHLNEAERILWEMLKRDIKTNTDIASYTLLINAWAELDDSQRKLRHIKWLFEKMKLDHKPDVQAYSAVIGAHAKWGNVAEAERILERVLEEGVVEPDLICFSHLIDGWARLGDVERAGRWFDEMKRREIPPTVHIYGALFNAHAKRAKESRDPAQIDEAKHIFDEMLQDGITPDSLTFASLIDGCAQLGDVDRATWWLNLMKRIKLRPNETFYNFIINAHVKKGIAINNTNRRREEKNTENMMQAENLLEEMLNEGMEPTAVSFTSLISGWTKLGDFERAGRWFDEMKRANIRPTVHTFSALINAHAKRGKETRSRHHIAETERIFLLMMKEDIKPNLVLFTSLIAACAQVGDLDRARKWFQSMRQQGIRPNARTYTAMFTACSKSRKPESFALACDLFAEMKRAESAELDAIALTSMMNVCANSRHNPRMVLRVAEEVINDIKKISKKAGLDRYHLTACVRLHKRHPDDARPKQWIRWMVSLGLSTNSLRHADRISVANILQIQESQT